MILLWPHEIVSENPIILFRHLNLPETIPGKTCKGIWLLPAS